MLLSRSDELLKDCSSRLSPEDWVNLCAGLIDFYKDSSKLKTILFVTKEHIQAVTIQISLQMHGEVAEGARGNSCLGARLQDFWKVW